MNLKSLVVGLVSVSLALVAVSPATAAQSSGPALAATGADLAALLPWFIVGAVIVLAGGILLVVRSRRKPDVPPTAPAAPELQRGDNPEA
ncbi:hypothetical protein HDC94_002152 [Leifsonia sp. AK011]|uniref:hypothetical protein n=1 Tax=Leifsonia sp. AK011 TaxID=2723075 RepID=UPI0015CBC180|nr:hypothetical protein [Leifsonia sp. AK011]NYF10996.1 hypothetical protein [Leifsonia sp. AK011]